MSVQKIEAKCWSLWILDCSYWARIIYCTCGTVQTFTGSGFRSYIFGVFLCMFSCFRWLLLSANAFPQTWHTNGFSPVWRRSWRDLPLSDAKDLWQYWQVNGFSPVWVLSCFTQLAFLPNSRPQNWHLNIITTPGSDGGRFVNSVWFFLPRTFPPP